MNRFFLGLLALAALALMISQAAVAGGGMHGGQNNQQANPEANSAGDVMIIETYTTSSATGDNNEMQPLPGDPGVEVAPNNNSDANATGNPVMVEEDMMVEQTESGE